MIARSRALRAVPLAVASLAATPALAQAAPARPQTLFTSSYGIDAPAGAVADGRAAWAWSGGRAGVEVTSAEHPASTGLWPAARAIASGLPGAASSVRMAANAAGATVAVWLVSAQGPGGATVTVKGARRTGNGTWTVLPDLATISDPGDMARADSPTTPLDLAVTPDGTAIAVYGTVDGAITAVRLAPAAAAWDAPVMVRPAIAGRVSGVSADLAVAAAPDNRVVTAWTEVTAANARSIQIAEWSGAAWAAAAALPGGADGYYPDVAVTPAGETVAAWTTPGGNWVATRPSGGAWSAVTRAGDGYAPEVAVGTNRVAVTWGLAGRGLAIRNAAGGAWTSSSAPVRPGAAAFTRDDQLLVAGTLESGVVVWARLPVSGSWAPARIASRQEDLFGGSGLVIVPAPTGPLATLAWTGNARPGRLGLRAGGAVLQGLDVSATTGDAVGSASRLTLPARPVVVNAYAVVSVSPRFTRYSGPTPVRIQTRRSGRWHTVGGATVDVERSVGVRVGGPGRVQLRLAYGPGFRRTTNAVAVTVRRTALRRVIAGWRPWAVAASGRDLWVLSGTGNGRPHELRLLDATTGRLRRGPVRIGAGSLAETGGPVLIDRAAHGLWVADAALQGLLGPPATLDEGGCTAAGCTPITVTGGGTVTAASRSVRHRTGPLRGPDGRVWGFGPGTTDESGGYTVPILESPGGGPPVTRDAEGLLSHHGGYRADMLAVDGGLWFRGALRSLAWVGTVGPAVAKGEFHAIAGTGRCVWGLAGGARPAIVRLREGAGANGTPIPLSGITELAREPWEGPIFAVGPRTGWAIDVREQSLVKVPLPAC